MRSARRPLELWHGLPWVPVVLRTVSGLPLATHFLLDTGASNTILCTALAEQLGLPESSRLGTATFDTPDGPIEGYTLRLPSLTLLGFERRLYLVGCKPFHARIDVPGVLGFDFFRDTDLLLSQRQTASIHLAW